MQSGVLPAQFALSANDTGRAVGSYESGESTRREKSVVILWKASSEHRTFPTKKSKKHSTVPSRYQTNKLSLDKHHLAQYRLYEVGGT